VIRFLLDEHVHPAVAIGLRLRGVEVTTATEAGLLGAPDESYVALAVSEERVIVTHDDDFLALDAAGTRHAGIAYCHQRARSVGELVNALVLIHNCLTSDEIENEVEFL
jgi:hypothetical protein